MYEPPERIRALEVRLDEREKATDERLKTIRDRLDAHDRREHGLRVMAIFTGATVSLVVSLAFLALR